MGAYVNLAISLVGGLSFHANFLRAGVKCLKWWGANVLHSSGTDMLGICNFEKPDAATSQVGKKIRVHRIRLDGYRHLRTITLPPLLLYQPSATKNTGRPYRNLQ